MHCMYRRGQNEEYLLSRSIYVLQSRFYDITMYGSHLFPRHPYVCGNDIHWVLTNTLLN
jgi:hypothetical protein